MSFFTADDYDDDESDDDDDESTEDDEDEDEASGDDVAEAEKPTKAADGGDENVEELSDKVNQLTSS